MTGNNPKVWVVLLWDGKSCREVFEAVFTTETLAQKYTNNRMTINPDLAFCIIDAELDSEEGDL